MTTQAEAKKILDRPTIKAVKSGKAYYHAECGGQLAVGAMVTRTFPIGFGFAGGDRRFRIDCIKQRGYSGFCMKCGQEGDWYVGKGRHVVKRPKL